MWGDCTVVLTLAEFPGHIWLVPVIQPVGSVTGGFYLDTAGAGQVWVPCNSSVHRRSCVSSKNGKECWEGHQPERSFVACERSRAPEEGGEPQEVS